MCVTPVVASGCTSKHKNKVTNTGNPHFMFVMSRVNEPVYISTSIIDMRQQCLWQDI